MENITLDSYIRKINRPVKPISELNLNFDRQGFKDNLRQGLGQEGGFSQRQAKLGREMADAINSRKINVEDLLQDIIRGMTPRMLTAAEQALEARLAPMSQETESNDGFGDSEFSRLGV